MIEADVSKGRAAMNFSEWPAKSNMESGLLAASCAALEQGLMPLPKYLMIHRDAKMSLEEKSRFCAWTSQESALLRHSAKH